MGKGEFRFRPDPCNNAAGRPIEAGEASGRDLAPSILQLMGVPVPETMEGRSLVKALEPKRDEAEPNRVTAQ